MERYPASRAASSHLALESDHRAARGRHQQPRRNRAQRLQLCAHKRERGARLRPADCGGQRQEAGERGERPRPAPEQQHEKHGAEAGLPRGRLVLVARRCDCSDPLVNQPLEQLEPLVGRRCKVGRHAARRAERASWLGGRVVRQRCGDGGAPPEARCGWLRQPLGNAAPRWGEANAMGGDRPRERESKQRGGEGPRGGHAADGGEPERSTIGTGSPLVECVCV